MFLDLQKNYAYGYDVAEYDEYGNPNVHSKHEERNGYEVKGETVLIINSSTSLLNARKREKEASELSYIAATQTRLDWLIMQRRK